RLPAVLSFFPYTTLFRSGFILYSELEHHWNPTELALSTQKGSLKFNSEQPTALKAGFIGYFSPLREWNQSLRLEVYGLTQSGLRDRKSTRLNSSHVSISY